MDTVVELLALVATKIATVDRMERMITRTSGRGTKLTGTTIMISANAAARQIDRERERSRV